MTTIHQRNQKFPTTMTLLANLPKFTSLSSARQICHWPAHNSINFESASFTYPFPPFHESFTVWKVPSLVINNSPMNRFPITNSLHKSKIPVLNIIPLLCRIWPGFKQKSSLFLPTKSWNDTNMCALIFLLDDKIRTTVQLITCTVPQNCLSLFTISQFTFKTFSTCPVELQTFSLRVITWVRSVLGANVTLPDILSIR